MFLGKSAFFVFLSVAPIGEVVFSDPGVPTISSTRSMQMKENLVRALITIGVPMSDILSFRETRIPPRSMLDAVTSFAKNSNKAVYAGLPLDEKGALTLFCFLLHKEKYLSSSALKTLMRDEKVNLGMSQEQVSQLEALSERITVNPQYRLTAQDTNLLENIAPYFSEDPYAFADVIGPLIGSSLYNASQGYTTPSSSLEQGLMTAAQSLTGLTDQQVENVIQIANDYQTTGTFTPTEENVSDINQTISISTLPDGTFLLSPLIGLYGIGTVSTIVDSYTPDLNQAEADHWSNANARYNYYQSTVQPNQEQRQSDFNERQGNIDTREYNESNAAAQREGTVSGRESNVSTAETNRENAWQSWGGNSSLNRDNVQAGGARAR